VETNKKVAVVFMLKQKESKTKDPINLIYMIKKIFPICLKSKPSYFVFNRTISLLQGISLGLNVMLAQIFFDTVYKASLGERDFNGVIIALILYIFSIFSIDILNAMDDFSFQVQHLRILGYMTMKINKKSALIDPIEYENPERMDDINKAANGVVPAIKFHFITAAIITRYLSYFIFMGFYLSSLNPMLILCLLFVFVPVLISQVLRSSLFSKLEDNVAPIRREFDAYNDAACGKNFYKETRILGSFKYLKNLLANTIFSLNTAIWRTNKRSTLIDLLFNTLSLLGYGGVLFLLIKYLLDGDISIGAFAAVYSSIGMLFGKMEEFISRVLGNIALDFGLNRNLLRFLDIPSDNRDNLTISKKDGIAIENMSFKYPNADKDALRNINLKIKPGETIAIVGENGSGKTTLVKLLTGLYKPTEGSVKTGETDVNIISYKSLFEKVSGVFQKHQRYALTLKENVCISDLTNEYSDEKIEKTLVQNNVDKNNKDTFPNGIDTMLSREFDGVDLSGGQWQRVAIARGFYRESDIIVLDEPTAAIDPIEESAIYKKFVEITKDKTAVIVTHRMGSAKIAERIVVMKDGEIAEIGSHNELMNSCGIYYGMYTAQAAWYK
jgi:ATP-binding cassette subfamily B protein